MKNVNIFTVEKLTPVTEYEGKVYEQYASLRDKNGNYYPYFSDVDMKFGVSAVDHTFKISLGHTISEKTYVLSTKEIPEKMKEIYYQFICLEDNKVSLNGHILYPLRGFNIGEKKNIPIWAAPQIFIRDLESLDDFRFVHMVFLEGRIILVKRKYQDPKKLAEELREQRENICQLMDAEVCSKMLGFAGDTIELMRDPINSEIPRHKILRRELLTSGENFTQLEQKIKNFFEISDDRDILEIFSS